MTGLGYSMGREENKDKVCTGITLLFISHVFCEVAETILLSAINNAQKNADSL